MNRHESDKAIATALAERWAEDQFCGVPHAGAIKAWAVREARLLEDAGEFEISSKAWATDGTVQDALSIEFRELFDECVGAHETIPIFKDDMGKFYVRMNGACRYDTVEECRQELDEFFEHLVEQHGANCEPAVTADVD
jgi:hypothetical protein